jgi:hypothetical protein
MHTKVSCKASVLNRSERNVVTNIVTNMRLTSPTAEHRLVPNRAQLTLFSVSLELASPSEANSSPS